MYRAAPANDYFRPGITIGDGSAEVRLHVRPDFFHAAGSAHGAVYFKLLDDATFFSVASVVRDVFVLTARFEITFRKPVSSGEMIATGRVTGETERRYLAEGHIVNSAGELVAEGRGEFARSRMSLTAEMGYR
jgi:uncharacterized protein (TIGR00369 family)